MIAKRDGALAFARELRGAKLDVVLSIDYRPSYDSVFRVLPRTPVVEWARDPRPPEDVAFAASIRIPGRPDQVPQGLGEIDCTPMRHRGALVAPPAPPARVRVAAPTR